MYSSVSSAMYKLLRRLARSPLARIITFLVAFMALLLNVVSTYWLDFLYFFTAFVKVTSMSLLYSRCATTTSLALNLVFIALTILGGLSAAMACSLRGVLIMTLRF